MQLLLALHRPTPGVLRRAEEVLRTCGDVWPQLAPQAVRVVRAACGVLAVVSAPRHRLPPALHVSPKAAFALDGLAFLDGGRMVGAEDLVDEPRGVELRLEGSHCWARLDLASGGIDVASDPLGTHLVFAAPVDGGWAVSNSALVLLRLRGAAVWDLDGVRSLLCLHGMGRGRSLFEGLTLVPAGHVWRAGPGESAPVLESYFSPTDVSDARADGVADELVREVCDAMRVQVRSAAATGRPLRAPITGGRDSRLIAAIIGSEGIDCDFFTSALPGSAEERSALEVARVLGVRHRVDHPKAADVLDRWDELVRRLLLQTDGLVSAWQVANTAVQDAPGGLRAIVLGGHGGELARTPFGDVTDLLPGGLSLRRIARMLPGRMVGSLDGLLTPATVEWTRALVADAVRGYGAAGWDPRNVPDVVAYFERQRVRDASAARPGNAVRDMLLPFYSRPFARLALSASYRERYASLVHERMLRVVAPAARSVRYSQLPGWWHRPAKDALGRLNAWVHSDRLRKKKVRTSPQQHWMEAVLPLVRARCLDARNSRLWEVVDRDAFEHTTAPEERPRLAARADGVLKVYSLFELERLAGVA